jgi:hypothetical protein
MIGGTREMTVMVWGEPVTVYVTQKSKSVWIASGSYLEHSIETKGSSATSAAKHWADAARYRGG